MFGRFLLAALLSIVHLCASCPENCHCILEGRGLRVVCENGDLSAVMAKLPHNTAQLSIQSLSALHILRQVDMEQNKVANSVLKLSITNSALQDVEGSAFASAFASLQDLDLSKNSIKTIDIEAFSGLTNLRSLNLSGNHIDDLGLALDPLVSLISLDLSWNYISDLQAKTLRSQSSLKYLHLNGNHFRTLTGDAFQPLAFLSELRVRDCGLSSVSESFFSAVTRISLLDLSRNRLSAFPSSVVFDDLRQLKHLFINDNELLLLQPGQFADFNLLTLSLARNHIGAIPVDAFVGLTVQYLDLSENKLLTITGKAFQPIASRLLSLNLAHNPIRILSQDTFEGLTLLKTLNISACSLNNLPGELFGDLHNLRNLDASWNHLQNLSEPVIKVFNRLAVINLQQNFWHCDCYIAPFRQWLRSRSSIHKLYCLPGRHPHDCSELECSTPDELTGVQIASLDESQVEKCVAGVDRAGLPVPIQISIVLACLLFSLGMLLVTVYLWRRGRTRKGLKRLILQKKRKAGSYNHDDEENEKIDPFENCDNTSLKESHRSFVFRHYFDQMVTDPKLLEPTSPSMGAPSVALAQQKDSMYSSNPSLYDMSHNSRSIVVGIESTV